MKFIISPAKKLERSNYSGITYNPKYQEKANEIAVKLSKLTCTEISKAFKCSDVIAKGVKEMYANFNKERTAALFLYKGIQYKNIEVDSLKAVQLNYLRDNLIICDALYGFLGPCDLISPYRFDYKTKVDFSTISFYKEEAKKIFTEKVINLASKEFSEILPQDKLFNINFVQEVKGTTKSYSTATKIARGKFVNYLARMQNTNLQVLKDFSEDGYQLIEETENSLTFKKL